MSEALYDHTIDNQFVASMSNQKVEGCFNMMDIYGDVQLDPVRQEYILCYVIGVLAKDRKARRDASFRQREGTHKTAGEELRKHAWTKPQLEALADSVVCRRLEREMRGLKSRKGFEKADFKAGWMGSIARIASLRRMCVRMGRLNTLSCGRVTNTQRNILGSRGRIWKIPKH